MYIVRKTTQIGYSGSTEFLGDGNRKLLHLLLNFMDPGINGYQAVLVGKIAPVHFEESLMCEGTKTPYEFAISQGLTNIIDLPAFIYAAGIGEERDVCERPGLGCDIDELTLRAFPDGMKLCLDKDTFPLPNSPPQLLFASVLGDLAFKNHKTFIEWCARTRLEWNCDRFLPEHHGATEC